MLLSSPWSEGVRESERERGHVWMLHQRDVVVDAIVL